MSWKIKHIICVHCHCVLTKIWIKIKTPTCNLLRTSSGLLLLSNFPHHNWWSSINLAPVSTVQFRFTEVRYCCGFFWRTVHGVHFLVWALIRPGERFLEVLSQLRHWTFGGLLIKWFFPPSLQTCKNISYLKVEFWKQILNILTSVRCSFLDLQRTGGMNSSD